MNDRQLTLVLSTLAQPNRLRLMREVVAAKARGGLSTGEVAGKNSSGTTLHLRELERAGLVGSDRCGHAICYQASPAALRDVVRALEEAIGLAGPGVAARAA